MPTPIEQIPEKPFYKVQEVCDLTDTQPYVLRFWESEFPQLRPEKSKGGQAVYRRRDVALVLRIKELLYEQEYTITGARKVLDENPLDVAAAETPEPVEPEPSRSRSKKRSRAKAAPVAADPQETAAPVAAAPEPLVDGPDASDVVARERYDRAVDEIGELRLRVQELEADLQLLRESQSAEHRRLQQELARRERVTSILERVLEDVEASAAD